MGWLVVGCLCLMAAMGNAGVVPTQDTLVVTKSDDATPQIASEEPTEATPTTEGPLLPIKMTEMKVNSQVSMRYAHTTVVSTVRNPAKRSQEAVFRLLLPETAFISGFTMIIGGKGYKAYVKEKEEAKQIYTEAVSQGLGAAHIAAKARDSNHFTVSVNIEPNSTAIFNLTYEEMLTRRNGVYNHAINLHPGQVVPKLVVTVNIKESQKLTVIRVPEVRTGNEIDATENDKQNPSAVIDRCHDDRKAIITFKPDVAEQKKLMEIYAQKTKQSMTHSHRWYFDEPEPTPEGVLGQFVVQYDVDRPEHGEILVNNGYFVHLFAPKSLIPLSKHVVFVLDTSGSMMDRKIEQLREAMKTILPELNKGDYFSIVEFASSVLVHDLKEADGSESPKTTDYYSYETEPKPVLVPPFQATPSNIDKAKTIVGRLQASGGTNIAGAMDVAIDLIHKGVGWTQAEANVTSTAAPSSTTVTSKTEETPTEKTPVTTDKVNEVKDETKIEKDEKETKEDAKKLEPIIIFLTDGDPTVGETDTRRIISRLTEKNYGSKKASIFSLAFGEDADRSFLRKLSLKNDGFMRHIYEDSDSHLQLFNFYQQVSSPLLSNVTFIYPADQVKSDSLTKHAFRTIYDGGETVIAGRVIDTTDEVAAEVSAFCGVDEGSGRKKYQIFPKVPVARSAQEYLPLERLWAYLTIKQLLDDRDAADLADAPKDKVKGFEKKALDLALKYEFVTPLTSLVVVKPNATKAVNTESVDKKTEAFPLANYASSPISSFGQSASAGYSSFGASSSAQAAGYYPLAFSQVQPAYYQSAQQFVLEDAPLEFALEEDLEDIDTASISYAEKAALYSPSRIRIPVIQQNKIGQPYDYTTVPTELPTDSEDPLEPYNLADFSWVQPLLNEADDELLLDVNGTNVHLKLSKDIEVPKLSSGDAECEPAIGGAMGTCVYLTRCDAAKTITPELYLTTYCTVNNEYAGVCCPREEEESTPAP